MSDTHSIVPDLNVLTALFYGSTDELGQFTEVSAEEMPVAFQTLLAHDNHMTVTVEAFHGSPVDVIVLDKRVTPDHYARKILLTRQSDAAVVQYGIMRINFQYVSDAVRRQIETGSIPLGRVLITHNVLRQVELVSLWRVSPGQELADHLGLPAGRETFGRTALIHVDGEPAVELLEIVTIRKEIT